MSSLAKPDIGRMRLQGMTYRQMAEELGISANTIKSFCRRNGIQRALCKNCGEPLVIVPGCKAKIFCNSRCRNIWWRSQPEQSKAASHFSCKYCQEPCVSYGSRERKYCSRSCYINDRYCPP